MIILFLAAHPGSVCYSHAHCQMFDERTHCDFLIPNLFGRCGCTAPAKLNGGLCLDEQQLSQQEAQFISSTKATTTTSTTTTTTTPKTTSTTLSTSTSTTTTSAPLIQQEVEEYQNEVSIEDQESDSVRIQEIPSEVFMETTSQPMLTPSDVSDVGYANNEIDDALGNAATPAITEDYPYKIDEEYVEPVEENENVEEINEESQLNQEVVNNEPIETLSVKEQQEEQKVEYPQETNHEEIVANPAELTNEDTPLKKHPVKELEQEANETEAPLQALSTSAENEIQTIQDSATENKNTIENLPQEEGVEAVQENSLIQNETNEEKLKPIEINQSTEELNNNEDIESEKQSEIESPSDDLVENADIITENNVVEEAQKPSRFDENIEDIIEEDINEKQITTEMPTIDELSTEQIIDGIESNEKTTNVDNAQLNEIHQDNIEASEVHLDNSNFHNEEQQLAALNNDLEESEMTEGNTQEEELSVPEAEEVTETSNQNAVLSENTTEISENFQTEQNSEPESVYPEELNRETVTSEDFENINSTDEEVTTIETIQNVSENESPIQTSQEDVINEVATDSEKKPEQENVSTGTISTQEAEGENFSTDNETNRLEITIASETPEANVEIEDAPNNQEQEKETFLVSEEITGEDFNKLYSEENQQSESEKQTEVEVEEVNFIEGGAHSSTEKVVEISHEVSPALDGSELTQQENVANVDQDISENSLELEEALPINTVEEQLTTNNPAILGDTVGELQKTEQSKISEENKNVVGNILEEVPATEASFAIDKENLKIPEDSQESEEKLESMELMEPNMESIADILEGLIDSGDSTTIVPDVDIKPAQKLEEVDHALNEKIEVEIPDLVAEDSQIKEEQVRVIEDTTQMYVNPADKLITFYPEMSNMPEQELLPAIQDANNDQAKETNKYELDNMEENRTLSPEEIPFDMSGDEIPAQELESHNLIVETSTISSADSNLVVNELEPLNEQQILEEHVSKFETTDIDQTETPPKIEDVNSMEQEIQVTEEKETIKLDKDQYEPTASPSDIIEITTQTMAGLASRVTIMEPAAPIITTLKPHLPDEFFTTSAPKIQESISQIGGTDGSIKPNPSGKLKI